jgi:hypothetical protein
MCSWRLSFAWKRLAALVPTKTHSAPDATSYYFSSRREGAGAASRNDWKTTPLPAQRQAINLDRTYAAAEFTRLQQGHVPLDMDDRWFVFYEEPWLYLHRSWTGFCVYQVRFEPTTDEVRCAESLVNRESRQYRMTDDDRDVLFLKFLLDGYAGRPTEDSWRRFFDSQSSG